MVTDLVAGAFLVAVIYILVRPGGQGTTFVQAFGAAMSAIISQATDLAGSASNDRSGGTNQGN